MKLFAAASALSLNNKFKLIVPLAISSMLFTPVANSSDYHPRHHEFNYIGADIMHSSMKFKKDFGENIFAKSAAGASVFFGHMYNKNFGFEIGYEVDKKRKRSETVKAGETVAGNLVIVPDIFESYDTEVSRRQPYLGMVARVAMTERNFFQVLLGCSLVHVRARSLLIKDGTGPIDITRTYASSKPVAMARAVLEHKFTDHFGIRAFAGWRNTEKMKIMSQEKSALSYEVKLKNAINFGAGFTYYTF